MNCISRLIFQCTCSATFRSLSLHDFRSFIHRTAHIVVCQSFATEHLSLGWIQLNVRATSAYAKASAWQKTMIDASGPIAGMCFSATKLMLFGALNSYISWPIALALSSIEIVLMLSELFHICLSALKQDHGDFGCIAQRNKIHLALASLTLLIVCSAVISMGIASWNLT